MIAYNRTWLYNLSIVKESKRWLGQKILSNSQYNSIAEAHPTSFYHPNVFIRILLFLATLVALGGIEQAVLVDGADVILAEVVGGKHDLA